MSWATLPAYTHFVFSILHVLRTKNNHLIYNFSVSQVLSIFLKCIIII